MRMKAPKITGKVVVKKPVFRDEKEVSGIQHITYGLFNDGTYRCTDTGNKQEAAPFISAYTFLLRVTFWLIGPVYFELKVLGSHRDYNDIPGAAGWFDGKMSLKPHAGSYMSRFIIWILQKFNRRLGISGMITVEINRITGDITTNWNREPVVSVYKSLLNESRLSKLIKKTEAVGFSMEASMTNVSSFNEPAQMRNPKMMG